MSLLIPLGLCFFIIYFMMIRPQKRQMKEREEMLGSVRKGDEVVTSSGLIGTIQKIKDQEIVLVIDPEHNVKVKMLKSAVLKINKASGQDDDEEEEKKPDSTQKEAKS
jgi:preprotein translocase subunit YajC